MNRAAILGLGLMGGSLARALLAEGRRVAGWAPDAVDRHAAAAAGVEVAPSAAEAVVGAEVVVLASPIGAVGPLLRELAPRLSPDAVVTDVASLQVPVLDAADAVGLGARTVTAHPLAGGERSGFSAGSAELYRGAPLFLSARDGVDPARRDAVERFWGATGARIEWIDAVAHDARMSRVSHLPQVVSTALADTLARGGVALEDLGPGGRDTTRLAASSPAMWADLFAHADPALAPSLRAVAAALIEDAEALEAGTPAPLVARLERAGTWRREEG